MKKVVLTIIGAITGLHLMAQMSSVQGVVEPGSVRYKNMELMRIEHGAPITIATTEIAADGSYGFLFTPATEGMYAIGSNSLMDGQFELYIKKGDQVQFNINDVKGQFVGSVTSENKVLQSWNELAGDIKFKSVNFNKSRSTYVDFFPAIDAVNAKVPTFQKQIKTGNAAFDTFMKEYVRINMDFYAINFLSTPRTAHPDSTVTRPAIYADLIQDNRFAGNQVMQYLYGRRYLGMYLSYVARQKGIKEDAVLLGYLSNNEQKGAFLSDYRIRSIKSYDQFVEFNQQYGQYFEAAAHKALLENLGAQLYSSKEGQEASDFTYPDANGKNISLSDYKGEVVLVDVWATWCGPCKAEFPALRKLHEEMKGKNVEIISVSVDEAKNKDKWLQMIKDENLGGIQLFAGSWDTKITKDYKIKGIPRFMVFNKEGKVVTADAPRPSDPELKKMLERELKK